MPSPYCWGLIFPCQIVFFSEEFVSKGQNRDPTFSKFPLPPSVQTVAITLAVKKDRAQGIHRAGGPEFPLC